MTIRLHKELGINARVIRGMCPVCGNKWDTNEIILLGNANFQSKCPLCEQWIIGGVNAGKQCPSCGNTRTAYERWERQDLGRRMDVRLKRVCPDCTLMLEQGVVLVEVADSEDCQKPARTGRLFCIKEKAARGLGVPEGHQIAYITASVADSAGFNEVKPLHESVQELEAASVREDLDDALRRAHQLRHPATALH